MNAASTRVDCLAGGGISGRIPVRPPMDGRIGDGRGKGSNRMSEPLSFLEQLDSVRSRLGGRRAEVQPVSQVTLEIPTRDPEATLEYIRKIVLNWISQRAGTGLPASAWEGAAFELSEVGAQHVQGIVIANPRCWAARIDDADRAVPQRTWVSEVALAIAGPDRVIFGCRLNCVARGENPIYQPSVPGFVRRVAGETGARVDGRPVSAQAWRVGGREAVNAFIALLNSASRRCPVIAVSEGQGGESPVIDADRLAAEAIGVAHVAVLSADATYGLTDAFGKEFSVFNRAVRTYRPGFNPDEDEPSAHPLAMAPAIERWANRGAEGFRRFLVSQALRDSVARRDFEAELPPFSTLKVLANRQARERAFQEGRSDQELLALALEDNEELKRKIEEDEATYSGLLDGAEKDHRQLVQERDEARAELASLRFRIEHLEKALEARDIKDQPDIPTSLETLEHWASRHLAGSVVILNRAYREARKSAFDDAQLAYEALLVLRDHYAPMRREGGLERKRAYEHALREVSLEETASFTSARAGEQGDEYFVLYQGRRRELDRHLKGSSTRDERFAFRLYFFWDADSRQVVVGWLPTHLRTRAT